MKKLLLILILLGSLGSTSTNFNCTKNTDCGDDEFCCKNGQCSFLGRCVS